MSPHAGGPEKAEGSLTSAGGTQEQSQTGFLQDKRMHHAAPVCQVVPAIYQEVLDRGHSHGLSSHLDSFLTSLLWPLPGLKPGGISGALPVHQPLLAMGDRHPPKRQLDSPHSQVYTASLMPQSRGSWGTWDLETGQNQGFLALVGRTPDLSLSTRIWGQG